MFKHIIEVVRIAVISGSSRSKRQSHQVAQEVVCKLNDEIEGVNAWILDIKEQNLPLIDNTFSTDKNPTEQLINLSGKLGNSDGLIIVSPEWNGTYPGGLKNTMDYFLPEYKKKAFGIIGVSSGVLGGINAAKNLVTYVQHLKGILSPSLLITPKVNTLFEGGKLIDESYIKRLDSFLKEFLWLANALVSTPK